jgi:LL-H family phage holin
MALDPQLVNTIVTSIVGLLLTVALTWLSKFLKSRLSAGQLATAQDIAGIVVDAVEQMAIKAGWDGPTKYVEAVLYFTALAKKAGISMDETQIRALIEKSVQQMKEWWVDLPKEEPKPV